MSDKKGTVRECSPTCNAQFVLLTDDEWHLLPGPNSSCHRTTTISYPTGPVIGTVSVTLISPNINDASCAVDKDGDYWFRFEGGLWKLGRIRQHAEELGWSGWTYSIERLEDNYGPLTFVQEKDGLPYFD
jgi:hypothetical protein